MLEDFWNELNEEEFHVRDSLQFELKSEFYIHPHLKQNVYKQEVYIFIPNTLQINAETYSKQQFYLDQTTFIRYKTPIMTLSDLTNFDNSSSPLSRLHFLLKKSDLNLFLSSASDELKLFAAIFRRTIRERIYQIIKKVNQKKDIAHIPQKIADLCAEINEVCHKFRQLQEIAGLRADYPLLIRYFKYIDEFMSMTIDEFLVILLHQYRSLENYDRNVDKIITQSIIKEKLYRKQKKLGPKTTRGLLFANESILYRQGLLQRFVLESLMLKNIRFSLEEKHRHILGAIAAGFAMLVYMTLFVWKSSTFVINSFPFVALAVFFYILKDRLKEGLKTLYAKKASRWFPDYSTNITSSKGFKLGTLSENFTFIDPKQIPENFLKIRAHHFHEELQALHRHETIIQYKREMTLYSPSINKRRREITTIFRLNIHRFLQKASDSLQPNLNFDTYTQEITENFLPKIYHISLIIRHSFLTADGTLKVEIKAYRVVVDKNGIKRVEPIRSS